MAIKMSMVGDNIIKKVMIVTSEERTALAQTKFVINSVKVISVDFLNLQDTISQY